MQKKLLICGGGYDANLPWLQKAAQSLDISCQLILINPQPEPELVWNLEDTAPIIDGVKLDYTCAFLRYDVFSGLYSKSEFVSENATNWFALFNSCCQSAGLFTFNANISPLSGSKISMLQIAKTVGLDCPETIVTNSRQYLEKLETLENFIAKPVAGGCYCLGLDKAFMETEWAEGKGASPAIVQPMLQYPEFRVYRIGDEFFTFHIDSKTLDSRIDTSGKIIFIAPDTTPKNLIKKIKNLTDEINCDFCAIDLKTDETTGKLAFLELNNGPMFMGYDKTCGGKLAVAMVNYLAKDPSK